VLLTDISKNIKNILNDDLIHETINTIKYIFL